MAYRSPAGFDRHPFDGLVYLETMMTDDELDLMAALCTDIDIYAANKLKEAMEQHDREIVINVMLNVATSLLSKTLLLIDRDKRQTIMQTAISLTYDKTKEGDALIRSLLAAQRISADYNTCSPYPPTKH